MKVFRCKLFFHLARFIWFLLLIDVHGHFTQECGYVFPILSEQLLLAQNPDSFIVNGTHVLFQNHAFCDSGEIERVQIRGKCVRGLIVEDEDNVQTGYKITLQILQWSIFLRSYIVARGTELIQDDICTEDNIITFSPSKPLGFVKGNVFGLYVPRSDAIQLGLVNINNTKDLQLYEELAVFHKRQANFTPRHFPAPNSRSLQVGYLPLVSLQVSGCSCSYGSIMPSPITVEPTSTSKSLIHTYSSQSTHDQPQNTPGPATHDQPQNTPGPADDYNITSSAVPDCTQCELLTTSSLSIGFDMTPVDNQDSTVPSMMAGIAVLSVFLGALALLAFFICLFFSIWRWRNSSKVKESIYSTPVESVNETNEPDDIYDEIQGGLHVATPYEVPIIVQTDEESGYYENISTKPSTKVLTNNDLKMNNVGLYESLLVVQRHVSMTPSDLGSICEVDASTAIETPKWTVPLPQKTTSQCCLEDEEHLDAHSECQYYQLEPFHPNPIEEIPSTKRAMKNLQIVRDEDNTDTKTNCHYHQLEPLSPNPTTENHKSKNLTMGTLTKKDKQNQYWSVEPCQYEPQTPRTECDIYWPPSQNENDIYDQLIAEDCREIPCGTLSLCEKLGEGHFGEVHEAIWLTTNGEIRVAVKMLNKDADNSEKIKLLQEAAVLGQFNHPNIVTLYGVVTLGKPIMFVMELLSNGDLSKYLTSLKKKKADTSCAELFNLLLGFCRQIAEGLAYLSDKAFVHRDIAARNVLLDKELNCKISDFGLTKDLSDDDYYVVRKGGCIPVKWTAPEALFYKKYSTSSDIWSYGMTMYEVWSLGCKPFADKTIEEVVEIINTGYCHPPPPGCPRTVYSVMVKCWNPDHSRRPDAKNVLTILMDARKFGDGNQVKLDYDSDGDDRSVLFKDLQTLYVHNQ